MSSTYCISSLTKIRVICMRNVGHPNLNLNNKKDISMFFAASAEIYHNLCMYTKHVYKTIYVYIYILRMYTKHVYIDIHMCHVYSTTYMYDSMIYTNLMPLTLPVGSMILLCFSWPPGSSPNLWPCKKGKKQGKKRAKTSHRKLTIFGNLKMTTVFSKKGKHIPKLNFEGSMLVFEGVFLVGG